jgi:colanic acid biosynthesis glycosyl transferase WcaI
MKQAISEIEVERRAAERIPFPRHGQALPTLLPSVPPLADKHLLLVGINYAPESTGTAPYTTGMSEHLARHARSVTVLTGMPHYPNWKTHPEHRWVFRSTEEVSLPDGSGLTLKRTRHYVPSRQSALTRAGFEASFLASAVTTRLRFAPDLVIAVTPGLSGAVAGARLARRNNSKLMVVVQELTARAASQTGIPGGDYAVRTAESIERWAVKQADLVAVVSDAFRPQLHEYDVPAERIASLPNWTHISPSHLGRTDSRSDLGWPLTPFTVVHTGNIGLKQDLVNVVEAARLLRTDREVRFVIVGDGSQRSIVEAAAKGLDNLSFLDPLDPLRYPTALAAADVLIVNERPGVGDMSLPSKLTSYLSAERPILAAVAENGATAQELRRTRGGALVVPPGDPTAIARAVLQLRSDPVMCAEMARAGKSYAETMLDKNVALERLSALVTNCLEM